MKKRKFIKSLGLGLLGSMGTPYFNQAHANSPVKKKRRASEEPVFISTWNAGKEANSRAYETLESGGSILDACEKGVNLIESDPTHISVGYGGRPDRDGVVSLDACIMDSSGNAGSVCALEKIVNPVSVARKVMEETPHVILAGDGALQFAQEQGFQKKDLLTENSKKAWKKWLVEEEYKPMINIENHDTIGMVGVDGKGEMSGVCTTSGLAYKLHGRVGDSPIIGAGMYVDNEIGGAAATGVGEYVLKALSTFYAVMLMEQGYSPQKAAEAAIEKIVEKYENHKDIQVGIIVLNKSGQIGAYAIQKGFTYVVNRAGKNTLFNSKSIY